MLGHYFTTFEGLGTGISRAWGFGGLGAFDWQDTRGTSGGSGCSRGSCRKKLLQIKRILWRLGEIWARFVTGNGVWGFGLGLGCRV